MSALLLLLAASANAAPPPPDPPQNFDRPLLNRISGDNGDTISTSDGTWTGTDLVFSYAWHYDTGEALPGSGPGYTISGADLGHNVLCTVTASNAGGATPADSSNTCTCQSSPTNTSPPQVTPSSGINIGDNVSVDTGSWSYNPTSFNYQWMSNGASVGSDTPVYNVQFNDLGNGLSCRVTANNAQGSGQVTSGTTSPVGT